MKQEFWKEPITEGITNGCPCCPKTNPVLCVNTKLYKDFGGYDITQDGKVISDFKSGLDDWDSLKTLKEIEETLPQDESIDFQVHLNLPLRSGIWQRQGLGNWVLIEHGQGFA